MEGGADGSAVVAEPDFRRLELVDAERARAKAAASGERDSRLKLSELRSDTRELLWACASCC